MPWILFYVSILSNLSYAFIVNIYLYIYLGYKIVLSITFLRFLLNVACPIL